MEQTAEQLIVDVDHEFNCYMNGLGYQRDVEKAINSPDGNNLVRLFFEYAFWCGYRFGSTQPRGNIK